MRTPWILATGMIIGLAQVACEAAPNTQDTGVSSAQTPVVVVDCETAALSLREAGRQIRTLANKVDHRCVPSSHGFNASKCALRRDAASEAVQDAEQAEQEVALHCATL